MKKRFILAIVALGGLGYCVHVIHSSLQPSEADMRPSNSASAPSHSDTHAIPTPPPTQALTSEANASESAERFATLLEESYVQMPGTDELQNLSDAELHHMPATTEHAGKILGRIADEIYRDPSLIPQAIKFYRRCALSDDFIPAVRALCLANYHKRDQQADPIRNIPENVRTLAQSLDF